jgi:hypothetical protein
MTLKLPAVSVADPFDIFDNSEPEPRQPPRCPGCGSRPLMPECWGHHLDSPLQPLGDGRQQMEPKPGRKVRCRRCKQQVSARGLAGHVGGSRCVVDAVRVKMARRGYRLVMWPLTDVLRRAGIAMEYAPIEFRKGFQHKKSEIKCGWWAPTKAVEEVKALVAYGLPARTVCALFRADDRERIEGYITIAALGDQ